MAWIATSGGVCANRAGSRRLRNSSMPMAQARHEPMTVPSTRTRRRGNATSSSRGRACSRGSWCRLGRVSSPTAGPPRSRQRLDLALFVDTEDQGLFGRIHEAKLPDDVGELLEKPRVRRQLEGTDAVRLQPVRLPNPMNRRRTQPLRSGHGTQTPVGRPRRRGVQRRFHDLPLAGRR